jgi:riboflavin synthase
MFTGLVEEAGKIAEIVIAGRTARITVESALVYQGAALGDSIAVNGCCLTVVAIQGTALTFEAVPETMERTNLGDLAPGSRVNLERPLQAGARLGGHFVQGHVDGVGIVTGVTPVENAVVIEVELSADLARYVVEKGSISVDGVSLTVAGTQGNRFTVWTIPHTREVTTLGARIVGDRVNIECDLLGKYVERLLQFGSVARPA